MRRLTLLVILPVIAFALYASESDVSAKSSPQGLLAEWDKLDEESRTSDKRDRIVNEFVRNPSQMAAYIAFLSNVETSAGASTELLIEAISKIGDKAAVPALVKIATQSPNYELRRQAFPLLGRLADSSIIPTLLPAIDTAKDTKQILEHQKTLDFAVDALTALGQRFDGHRILIDQFKKTLPTASDPFKVRAVQTLRGIETREAEDLMLTMLSDPSSLVRFNTVSALGYSGQGRAPDALQDLLVNTTDPNMRKGIVVALGRYKWLPSLDVLIPYLDTEEIGLKDNVIYAIRNTTGQTFKTSKEAKTWLQNERAQAQKEFDELAAVVKGPNPEYAAVAIEKLAKQVLLRSNVVELLLPMLGSPNHRVRAASCFTLGKTGELRVYGALIERLRDSTPEVSYAAWRALKETTSRDFPRDFTVWREWLDKRN